MPKKDPNDVEEDFKKIFKIVNWVGEFITMVQRDDPETYEQAAKGERYIFALKKLVQKIYNNINKLRPPLTGMSENERLAIMELERMYNLEENNGSDDKDN